MIKSFSLFSEANKLTQPPDDSGKGFQIPKKQEQKIFSLIEKGLILSEKVNNDFLNYLHPALAVQYRNKLVKGNRLYYEGLKQSKNKSPDLEKQLTGFKKQVAGNRLIMEWSAWWELNKNALVAQAFPD